MKTAHEILELDAPSEAVGVLLDFYEAATLALYAPNPSSKLFEALDVAGAECVRVVGEVPGCKRPEGLS